MTEKKPPFTDHPAPENASDVSPKPSQNSLAGTSADADTPASSSPSAPLSTAGNTSGNTPSDASLANTAHDAPATPTTPSAPTVSTAKEDTGKKNAGKDGTERAASSANASAQDTCCDPQESSHCSTSDDENAKPAYDYLRNPAKKEVPLVWVPQQSSSSVTPLGKTPESSTDEELSKQTTSRGHSAPAAAMASGIHSASNVKDTGTDKNTTEENAKRAAENMVADASGGGGDGGGGRDDGGTTTASEDNNSSGDSSGDSAEISADNGKTDDEESIETSADSDETLEDSGEIDEEEEHDEEYEEEDDEEEEEEEEDGPTTLREHLLELRRRVFFMFLWALAGFALCFPFATDIFNHLMQPMIDAMENAMKMVPAAQDSNVIQLFMTPLVSAMTEAIQSSSTREMADTYHYLIQPMMDTMIQAIKGAEATHTTATLIYTAPSEAFFTEMKVAFVAGLFIMSPMIFYQVWRFVAPGLYREEKIILLPLAFSSGIFFVAGGAFCYGVAFPTVFKFFMSYNSASITAMPSLRESLSFALQFMVAFGVVFEMPLFTFFLARLGIVTGKMMRSFWRYSVIIILVIAAVLTPPDVISQCLMAGPMLLLYILSVGIAEVFGKKTLPEETESDETESDHADTADHGDEEDNDDEEKSPEAS